MKFANFFLKNYAVIFNCIKWLNLPKVKYKKYSEERFARKYTIKFSGKSEAKFHC